MAKTVEVLKLNEISSVACSQLPDNYKLVKESAAPEGIILRSFSMHEYDLPKSVLCVARAGAGVNNIPIDKYTQSGVVVFNTPGANANAVKELVICSLMLASRKIIPSIDWAKGLKGKGAEVGKMVEKGKGQFVGAEILGKKLGVVGLGAIGALVANAAVELGMEVVGYDPFISIDAAWTLSNNVKHETDLDKLYKECDYITLHLPYNSSTKGMIGKEVLAKCKDGACIINCSRGELVDSPAMLEALKSGKIGRYVTDFPTDELLNVENVVAIPHLGASTPEAEDNCAVMAARQLADFIDNGNITNSVNFPNCKLPRTGKYRLIIIHKNVKNVISKITELISSETINIGNMLSQSQGDYAYAIFELDDSLSAGAVDKLGQNADIISIRVIK